MYARFTEIRKDFRTMVERAPQGFGREIEQTRLEAVQAKQLSGEVARTTDALTTAITESQAEKPSARKKK